VQLQYQVNRKWSLRLRRSPKVTHLCSSEMTHLLRNQESN
jgi:hypothetical protein